MRRTALIAASVAIMATVTGTIIAGSGASAQVPTAARSFTFKELNRGASYHEVDVPPISRGKRALVSPGDQLVTSSPLASASGQSIGKIYGRCTALTKAPLFTGRYLCDGLIALHDGTLTLQFLLATLTAKASTFTITGGTAAYANARGTMTSRTTRTGYNHTIILAT